MLKFRRPNQVPPGGRFAYVTPDGVTFINRDSRQELVREVTRWYGINGKPIPENLADTIEDFICRQVADGFCEGSDEGRPRSPYRNLSFWEAEKRTRKCLQGITLTNDIEAERRALVCLRCPENLRHMCTSCNGLQGVFRGMTRGHSTRVDDYIGVCGLTGCVISAMVFRQDATVPYEGELPAACWLVRRSHE